MADLTAHFPIICRTRIVAANIVDLEKKVLEVGADMGFAYDTDWRSGGDCR